MSNTLTTRAARLFTTRSRSALVAAGLATAIALPTGGAALAADSSAPASVLSEQATAELIESAQGRGDTQLQAATAASEAQSAKQATASGGQSAEQAAQRDEDSWVSPITDDYELTGTFGDGGDRWASSHSGQDFAVPTGTSVHSVYDGTVVKAGGNGAGDGPAYGNAVVIEHTDGTYTQYAHLSEVQVSIGDEVEAGDQIALSGNTGNSSGPHLHFEVRTTADFGSAVDPMAFLREHGADL